MHVGQWQGQIGGTLDSVSAFAFGRGITRSGPANWRLGRVSALERNDEIVAMLDAEQIGVLAKAFPSSHRLRNIQSS
jgi:hypothetical protein